MKIAMLFELVQVVSVLCAALLVAAGCGVL